MAAARPIPREAPVTRAVFPDSEDIVEFLRFLWARSAVLQTRCRATQVSIDGLARPTRPGRRSAVQESGRVFHEQLGVLVERAMVGVWKDDELSIRQLLLQDIGVHRRDDDV